MTASSFVLRLSSRLSNCQVHEGRDYLIVESPYYWTVELRSTERRIIARHATHHMHTTIEFTFSAWTTVRGKPSNRNPFLHSLLSKLVSIMSTTSSSDTSLPSSITFFSSLPSLEPDWISARSMSPVDKWHTQYLCLSHAACESESGDEISRLRVKVNDVLRRQCTHNRWIMYCLQLLKRHVVVPRCTMISDVDGHQR